MNSKVIFAFILGAAAGVAASWKFNEARFKRIADEEIESVKERFSIEKTEIIEVVEPEPKEDIEPSEEDYRSYQDLVKKMGYTKYSKNEEEKGGDIMKDAPYVIAPDEFGEFDEYETNSFTYYADGILADDGDDIIDDIDSVVGKDSLNHFGEYPDDPDTVYVRNDRLKTDYEINYDQRRYADVVDGYPIEDDE